MSSPERPTERPQELFGVVEGVEKGTVEAQFLCPRREFRPEVRIPLKVLHQVPYVDQIAQVLAGAEARVDVEEVLDGVPVVGLEVRALAPHRPDPQGGRAEFLEVGQLAGDARDGAALEGGAGGNGR